MEKLADGTEKQLEVKETCHHGIPMSDEELVETTQCWKDIEECFNNLEIIGDDEDNE